MRGTRKIVTGFYIGCSTYSAHVHFVDLLLSGYPLSRCLDGSSDHGVTPLGVGEILTMEDLEFPILLDKSDDAKSFERERDPRDGGQRSCGLRRG